MNQQHYKHADITRKIIGVAMKVHSTLGNGFQVVFATGRIDGRK